MTRITTKQFVAAIQGKNLSTNEIYALIKTLHPESGMNREQVRIRLRSMLRSPNVELVRTGQGNMARYLLISATECFIEMGDANYRTSGKGTKQTRTVWRFNDAELQFCRLHKLFDRLISNVSGEMANVVRN